MKRLTTCMAVVASLVGASWAGAQDYRGRVQGSVADESQRRAPGRHGHADQRRDRRGGGAADRRRRPLHLRLRGSGGLLDDRGAERLQESRAAQHPRPAAGRPHGGVQAVARRRRGDRRRRGAAGLGAVQPASADITLERQLIDQAPISGRNPYNLANLDPTIVVSPSGGENRPYHHAYANDYDAGGGTRRANDVLLDGVPLAASYKTAYTPAVDAVEEITVSKNSVDAENGHSLGGIISLNMKSGTNQVHGSGYINVRDPGLNARTDPTLVTQPGVSPLRGSNLTMYGGTVGLPIQKNRIFSFTSFEQWDDTRPLSIVRTVPTELERQGDFSQSLLNGRVRTIYNPYSSRSTRRPAAPCARRLRGT